jgi:phage repressor protein C with HTH and peptisase S24 domain
VTTKEKILKYLDFKNISKREFYLNTGLSNGFLDSGKYISTENAEIIISKYPDLSLEWLIMGTGEMIKTKSIENVTFENTETKTKSIENVTFQNGNKKGNNIEENEKYKKSYRSDSASDNDSGKNLEIHKYNFRTDSDQELQQIPLYNMEAIAGLVPLFNDSIKHIPIDYIQIPNLPKCDGAIYITGDSMYPLLKSGDIVLYKRVDDIINCIFWGEMYLISVDMGGEEYVTVKFIQKSDQPDFIRLVSHNQHHDDKDVPVSKIRALAFVKASIRINSMK